MPADSDRVDVIAYTATVDGDHVAVTFLAGPDLEHLKPRGTLTFTVDEWCDLEPVLRQAGAAAYTES